MPWIAAIVPLIGGIALWQILDQIMFLAFTLLSPVMLIGTYASDRASGRTEFRKASEALRVKAQQIAGDLGAKLADEQRERRDRFPDATEVTRRALDGDSRLWERRPHHADHLAVRLGLADQPSELHVVHPTRGDEGLIDELKGVLPERTDLVNVPLAFDLSELGTIGIAGPRERRAALARWLTLQLAVLQSPRDVELAALSDPAQAETWEWLKWLPHVRGGMLPQAGIAPVAINTLQVSRLTEAIGVLQRERSGNQLQQRGTPRPVDVVLIVDDEAVHDRAALSDVLALATATGVSVIWLAEQRGSLPGECRLIVDIDDMRASATVTDTTTGKVTSDVILDGIDATLAESSARALAPLRDATQAERGVAALPSVAQLADLEGLGDLSTREVLDRWAGASGPATFVLGAGPDGPLGLDLVEQGPHALVGGTPGAGKSELLRGMLASLALRYPPSRMTFLLIDFKGGAAFREFAGLPHTVGVVTDLDEHLAQRALTSFRAEITYREALLERHGAIDVLDLARRAPDVQLPRLLIVIDEFATLAQEVPDFVDGVIDVTQRGRSLGVHLILATQSPRGSVTGKIRANTNLAIALRTVSADESNDILGTSDAAAIPVSAKGRAWVRIGDKDLVPVQAAYVGAATIGEGDAPTAVHPFSLGGARPATGRGGGSLPPGVLTDLERIVEAVTDTFASTGADWPRPPWLPELGASLTLPAGAPPMTIGIGDEPARQRQEPVIFDPAIDGALIVLGGPKSGKTSTLAAVATSLAEAHTVDELHVYGLDCAGRALGAVAALPHCGAVVPGDDGERTAQLLAMLRRTLQQRRDRASAVGAADFPSLQRLAGEPVPRIVVLLDDYGGFNERYERVEAGRIVDELRATISDGPSFGVHFVISADRRSAIPTSVAASIPRRLVHRLADRDEYGRVGLPPRLADADVPPGRAFDEEAKELQLRTLTDPGETLTAALQRIGAGLEASSTDGAARRRAPAPVATLPGLVTAADLPTAAEPWTATLGLQGTDLAPLHADLSHGNFVIAGPYRSGRSTALTTVAAGLLASTPGLQAHLVAPRRSRALGALDWTSEQRSGEYSDVVALLEQLIDAADDGTPVLLAIDDANEIDPTGISGIERVLRQARDLPLRVVIAAESQALRTSYAPWHVQIRKDGHGLVLNPNLELDGDMLGARFPWRREISFPVGRGLYVESGGFELLQVADLLPPQ